MEMDETKIVYPVVTEKGLKFCKGKRAALKASGVPDIRKDLGKALVLLSEPGSKARVKWAGDKEWTQYGDLA
jgi:hypothetical protein